MADGLAHYYAGGEGQNTSHYYGGTVDKPKSSKHKCTKNCSKPCKKRK